jgi:hypothetical protein
MDNQNPPEQLRKRALELIQAGHSEPSELVEIMLKEGVSEDVARSVMSDLIDRNAIIFTKNWRVQLNPLASAAA